MKNYIDNDLFYNELIKSFEEDKLTDITWDYTCHIVDNIANKLHWKTNEQKEFCKEFAKENVKKYWRDFNPNYVEVYDSYVFNYFVELSKRGLAKGLNKFEKDLVK
jgi:hypothetical protein